VFAVRSDPRLYNEKPTIADISFGSQNRSREEWISVVWPEAEGVQPKIVIYKSRKHLICDDIMQQRFEPFNYRRKK
jgi:hypothetical protein